MKRPIIFRYVESAFHQLYCQKLSFILVDISKSYARKPKGFIVHQQNDAWYWYSNSLRPPVCLSVPFRY